MDEKLLVIMDEIEAKCEASGKKDLSYQVRAEIAESVTAKNEDIILAVMKREGVCHFEARLLLGDPWAERLKDYDAEKEKRFGVMVEDGEWNGIPMWRRAVMKDEASEPVPDMSKKVRKGMGSRR